MEARAEFGARDTFKWSMLVFVTNLLTGCICIHLLTPASWAGPWPAPRDQLRQVQPGLTIPRIIHSIRLDDRLSKEQAAYADSCKQHYSEQAGWTHVIWSREAAMQLANQSKHGWLQALLSSAGAGPEQEAQALRYYVLREMGGLFLDPAIECWREGSDMLAGYDLVLQGHLPGEPLSSVAMASIPGHPLWDTAIQLLKEQRGGSKRSGVLAEAFARHFNASLEDGLLPSAGQLPAGEGAHVYPAGSWFAPCAPTDAGCLGDVAAQRALGQAQLDTVVGMQHGSLCWEGAPLERPCNTAELKRVICRADRPQDNRQPTE